MRILLINHYAGSKLHGMEFRPFYLCRELKKLGHKVLIVAAGFSHLRRVNPQIRNFFLRENIDGVDFIWLKASSYQGNGLGRIQNILEFNHSLFRLRTFLAKSFNPDVVIASSTYPLDIFAAYLIARKAVAKLVFEIHDLWPLSPMEIGGYSKFNPLILVLQAGENFAFSFSDQVVSILPNTLQHCLQHGLKKEKFTHIPNGFPDEQAFCSSVLPTDLTSKINEQKEMGKLLVGYSGGHAISNALDCLIEAASRLDKEKYHVFFLGNGDQKKNLKQKALKLGACVSFFDSVPKNQVNDFLIRMDVLYIGWLNLPLYRFGISPNKLVDYLLSGKMIIHGTNAPNDLVADAKAGLSIPAEDATKLLWAIETASRLGKEQREAFGRNGREFALKNLSYSKLAADFAAALDR